MEEPTSARERERERERERVGVCYQDRAETERERVREGYRERTSARGIKLTAFQPAEQTPLTTLLLGNLLLEAQFPPGVVLASRRVLV